jgi:hypothetical protein
MGPADVRFGRPNSVDEALAAVRRPQRLAGGQGLLRDMRQLQPNPCAANRSLDRRQGVTPPVEVQGQSPPITRLVDKKYGPTVQASKSGKDIRKHGKDKTAF